MWSYAFIATDWNLFECVYTNFHIYRRSSKHISWLYNLQILRRFYLQKLKWILGWPWLLHIFIAPQGLIFQNFHSSSKTGSLVERICSFKFSFEAKKHTFCSHLEGLYILKKTPEWFSLYKWVFRVIWYFCWLTIDQIACRQYNAKLKVLEKWGLGFTF